MRIEKEMSFLNFKKFCSRTNKKTLFKINSRTLEKQHKAHPLIIFMIFDLIFSFGMRTNTGLHNILSDNSRQSVGNCECRVNPTVSVHDIEWNLIDDAVDGVTDILSRSDQQRKGNQYDHRRFVVQTEYVVVDTDLV